MGGSGKCGVVGCNTKLKDNIRRYVIPSEKNKKGKIVPLTTERRKRWLEAIKRDEEKLKNARICARHFITGRPVNDPLHPDYVPSQNLGYVRDIEEPQTPRTIMEHYETEINCRIVLNCTAQQAAVEPTTLPVVLTPSKWTPQAGTSRSRTSDPFCFKTPEEDRINIRNCNIARRERKLEIMTFTNLKLLKEDYVVHYVGLPKSICEILIEKLTPYFNLELNPTQCFFLTLMKLRHNFSYTDLSFRFQVHRTTVSRIFHKCVDILSSKLSPFILWPRREEIMAVYPECFKSFHKGVTLIIDCFEVPIERSSLPNEAVATWSSYKHSNTIKYLIGITPQGLICYISPGYVGRTSDTEIVETCGILDNLSPGDVVLADRGFHIKASVGLYCAEVLQPAFKRGKNQLHPKDVENSRDISNIRIHVERVIGHVRRSYRIMYDTVPMFFLREQDTNEATTFDKVATICCALINLRPSVIF